MTDDAPSRGARAWQLATQLVDLGYFEADLGSGALELDARARALWGLAPAAKLSLEALSAELTPAARVSWQEAVQRAGQAGEACRFQLQLQRLAAGSGPIVLQVSAEVSRTPDGAARLTGVVRELNRHDPQRLAQQLQAAQEADAKFRSMFEQDTHFAGILALDGRVMEANWLSVEGCGFTRDESVLGRAFWECGWWNRSPQLMETIRAATLQAADGRMVRAETEYYVADGSVREVDLIISPVTDDSGRVLFVAATGTDITERKRAEREAREADRRKDEFLATLAHELRNPLAPLRTGLEVIKHAPPGSGSAYRAQDTMERQLAHMVRLVDDLLDLSRVASGKLELRKERVELRTAIENAVETSAPALAQRKHELVLDLPEAPIWLDADITRLSQVVSNVLSNAAKYTPDGGRICVRVQLTGQLAELCVSDTGLGIPQDQLAQVFEMFAQVRGQGERSQGGLGIGLALARRLLSLHGGTIEAYSAGPGQGSTFTLRLPTLHALGAPAQPTPVRRATSAGSSQRRVLLVDDNVDAAELMAAMLELLGHRAQIAHDGPSALELAGREQPEVAFLDIGLPGMDGHEVARRFRADPALAGCVLVALTGWGSQDDKRRSREAGFDFHLTKPVETAALQEVLSKSSSARGMRGSQETSVSGR